MLIACASAAELADPIFGDPSIGTDNTDSKAIEAARPRAEPSLLAAGNEPQATSASDHSFLATVGHEIRTPLYSLLGMLELLALSRLDSEQRGTLETARLSGRALVRIVDDVLDLSSIAAGKLEIRLEPVSIATLLHRVVDTFHAAASANDVLLRCDIDSRINTSLLTDPLRVSQILNSFMNNALKSTARGHLELRAELLGSGGGADRVRLSVSDTGMGVEPEARKRTSERVEQAGGANTARPDGGTGLGLSISRRLADMLGGTIEVERAPGDCTTASVTLTLPICDAEPESVVCGAVPVVTPIFVAPAQSVGPLVLAVDDHPTNRELLARQLAALGLRVQSAASGEEALQLWRAGGYSVVVTDCNMPGMDGYALAGNIRAIEAKEGRRRTPIIAWTADVLAGASAQGHAAGMDDILTKPAELSELRETLSRWLVRGATPMTDADPVPDAPLGDMQGQHSHCLALEKIAATPALRAEILLDFMTQIRSDLTTLTAALVLPNLPLCRRIAHRMKGSSLMVGALALAAGCESMERAARQRCIEQAVAAKPVIDQALRQLEEHIAGLPGMIETQNDAS